MARITHGTLSAGTVATLTGDAEFTTARIINRDGAAEIFARGDGVDPTVAGDDCEILPAAMSYLVMRLSHAGEPTVLKLISSGTPTYSVKFS